MLKYQSLRLGFYDGASLAYFSCDALLLNSRCGQGSLKTNNSREDADVTQVLEQDYEHCHVERRLYLQTIRRTLNVVPQGWLSSSTLA